MRSSSILPLSLLAIALGACQADADEDEAGDASDSDGSGSEDGLPPIDPAICDGMEFDNVVDEASCDEIQGRGVEPEFAAEAELCRRLYVDLSGRVPTPAEFNEDCEGKSVDEIVDALIDRPEYVQLGQRLWADRLLTTSAIAYFEYIAHLDELIGQHYAGELSLAALAERVTVHPGFTGRFDGQDLVGYSFQAFLGRDAGPYERLGLEPLWHMLEDRYVEAHPDYYFGYIRAVANSVRCMGDFEQNCHSEWWGHQSVVLPVVEDDNYDYEGVNVYAVEDLSVSEWETLGLPGRLIAAQPVFYESAVEQSLTRYLGYEAGTQLPAVRQALTDMLVSHGGDIRSIEREILTSQLYTMAASLPDPEGTPVEEGAPDFWHGPMKQMSAEVWLDSTEALAGIELGACDHRYPNVTAGRPLPDSPYEDTWWHPSNYPKDPNWPAEQNAPDYTYRNLAQLLGGCPDQEGQRRFTGTGVMIAIAQTAVAQEVCAALPSDALLYTEEIAGADKDEETLRGIAEHMFRRALGSLPEDPAIEDAIMAAVDGCRDDADCTAAQFGSFTCAALLQSGPFLFY